MIRATGGGWKIGRFAPADFGNSSYTCVREDSPSRKSGTILSDAATGAVRCIFPAAGVHSIKAPSLTEINPVRLLTRAARLLMRNLILRRVCITSKYSPHSLIYFELERLWNVKKEFVRAGCIIFTTSDLISTSPYTLVFDSLSIITVFANPPLNPSWCLLCAICHSLAHPSIARWCIFKRKNN